MEQVLLWKEHLLGALGHPTFLTKQAFDLIHQPHCQVAGSPGARLGVFRRKENAASAERQVKKLDPHELADTTAQFVDHPHHQLVAIILDSIEEVLKLIKRHVTNGLSEAVISRGFSRRFHI
jgi:hypothetical protein